MKLLLNFILIIIISTINCYRYRNIRTKYGVISGRVTVFNKKSLTTFYGIPYAKPPIGKYRFKPPRELSKPAWKNKFNASTKANSCMQFINKTGFIGYDITIPTNTISEDCLQLNMWVPHRKKMPVFVFFHGGAYNFGSGSLIIHKGAILARKTNQIVIDVNYRLGFFGFAYLGAGSTIPGNMGLLDQQMALKWIYENIEKFNGNPKKITIWGQSSGSASATAHLFAPDSGKYFSKIIANSGTIINSWATINNKYAELNTRILAQQVGCKGSDNDILNCLQKADASNLIPLSLLIRQPEQQPVFYSFAPVEEDKLFFKGNVKHKFLQHNMKTDVDLWIGKTADEATYFMPALLGKNFPNCNFDPRKPLNSTENSCKLTYEQFTQIVFANLLKYIQKNEDLQPLIKEYLSLNLTEPRDMAARFLSDVLFDCDIIRFTDTYASKSKKNVFFYHFEKRSKISPFPEWVGVYHGADLEYEFVWPLIQRKRYPYKAFWNEHKYAHKTAKMFGRFNHYGRPASLWRRYNTKRPVGNIYENELTYNGPKRVKPVKTKTCAALNKLIVEYTLRTNQKNI